MAPVLIDPKPREDGFSRLTGHSLELGKVVAYQLKGSNFQILATRHGVDVTGHFPVVGVEGVTVLKRMLDRALKHHQHLKTFKDGETQTILDESVLFNEEAVSIGEQCLTLKKDIH